MPFLYWIIKNSRREPSRSICSFGDLVHFGLYKSMVRKYLLTNLTVFINGFGI